MGLEISLVDMRQNEVDLNVKDEDISVMHILQHELLLNKKVGFAGFSLTHPLTGQYEFRVVTESGSPIDALLESVRSAREYVAELEKGIKAELKG